MQLQLQSPSSLCHQPHQAFQALEAGVVVACNAGGVLALDAGVVREAAQQDWVS